MISTLQYSDMQSYQTKIRKCLFRVRDSVNELMNYVESNHLLLLQLLPSYFLATNPTQVRASSKVLSSRPRLLYLFLILVRLTFIQTQVQAILVGMELKWLYPYQSQSAGGHAEEGTVA